LVYKDGILAAAIIKPQYITDAKGLKTRVLLMFEYQADSGWRNKTGLLPEFALQYRL